MLKSSVTEECIAGSDLELMVDPRLKKRAQVLVQMPKGAFRIAKKSLDIKREDGSDAQMPLSERNLKL